MSRRRDRAPGPRGCTAIAKHSGKPCAQPAMRGQRVCRYHGGASPNARRAAQARLEAEAAARRARRVLERRLGGSLPADPAEALADLVAEGRANVAALRELVAELGPPPTPQELHERRQAMRDWLAGDRDDPPEPPMALFGPDHLGDAKPHVLVSMYAEERKLLLAAAKAAGDLGVAERAQLLEEQEAALIATVIGRVLADPSLSLSPELQQLGRQVAARELLALEPPEEAAA